MSRAPVSVDVAVAFSHSGEIVSWRTLLTIAQANRLDHALSHLLNLGHVAGFGIQVAQEMPWPQLLEQLRSRCGSMVVGACVDPPVEPRAIAPAFLMPVWAFDHETNGAPSATGQLLGLDLELIATPSRDEEMGAHLPGRNGLWLIHARPLF